MIYRTTAPQCDNAHNWPMDQNHGSCEMGGGILTTLPSPQFIHSLRLVMVHDY